MVKNEQVVNEAGEKVGERPAESRNMAFSSSAMLTLPLAQWSSWTVGHAVREGMKSNNWVYRCIALIVPAFTQLSFRVQDDKTKEFVSVPAVDNLLENPNPSMSRNDTFELIASWLLLAGRAYLWYKDNNLWPVSPDRLSPIRDKALNSILLGYATIKDDGQAGTKVEIKTDEIIPFLLLNPADPVDGLSPLQAAGKQVDIDNEQAHFNKSTMQNRGELSGFISFDEPLSQDQIDVYSEKVNNRYTGTANAKKIGIIGAGAKYQRIGATPVEMDFRESSISNRDKILSTFGVPPQLVGAQEASTFDNVKTAELLLWHNTVLPLANGVCDALTFFFKRIGLLKAGQKIVADTSSILVLQEQLEEKTKPAEALFRMGVPVSQVSSLLNLKISEYPNWDKPFNGFSQADPIASKKSGTAPTGTNSRTSLRSFRNIERELRNADDLAVSFVKKYQKLFDAQRERIFDLIGKNSELSETAVSKELGKNRDDWEVVITENYKAQASASADNVVVSERNAAVTSAIAAYLLEEEVVLNEVSLIEASTLSVIMLQIQDGLDQGLSPSAIQQNITDVSAFSSSRALLIARTVTGTAQSIGQLVGGQMGGATIKVWQTSLVNVRDLHNSRGGEEAPIDGVFERHASANGAYPRYPLDPNLDPGDRVNCRCSMTFRA